MSAAKIPPDPRSTDDPAAAGGGAGETDQRDRILRLPEDHVGPVEKRTRKTWVFEGGSMAHREVTYVPGLHKIFDEVLLHAADNKRRDATMDSLRVEVDAARCCVSVYYNGRGVPIELHDPEQHGVYAPEMVYGGGHLANRHEAQIAGVKLANVFSTEFVNMGKKSEPQITVCLQGGNWTRITFKPDLAKFNMTRIDDDAIALMRKRVVDMVAFVGTTVQVVSNGQRIHGAKSFSSYVFAYLKAASKERGEVPERICERPVNNDQWEVFATTQGGTHVDYVADQIAARIAKICREDFQVEESEVKRHLWVFVNAVMENPSFDSPTRDALITPQESFGSSCELSEQFIDNVYECIIVGELSPPCPWNRSYKDSKAKKRKL
ncbi:unnamed protein product [Urochloa decumbens]|uniref:DNA topoisomerase 2 n=1 Tax=Urochloa decumbens TaxID=240449 RepID=A0ABC8Y0B4_9POAL